MKTSVNSSYINIHKITLIILVILFLSFVYAIPQITEVLTPTGTTSNNSIIIEYNFTQDDSLTPSNVKWSWDSVNYTLIDDSLVLFFNFNNFSALGENSTKIVDISKYSNNGTVVGGATFNSTGGRYNGAINFNGANNKYVLLSNTGINIYSGSFNIWFKASKTTDGNLGRIAGKESPNGGFYLYQDSVAQVFNVYFRNMSATSTNQKKFIASNITVWNMFTVNWNSTNFWFSLNGDPVLFTENEIGGYTQSMVNNTVNWFWNISSDRFGCNTGGTRCFNGSIDDVMVFNRSLSALEIQQLYYSSLAKYDSQNWSFYTNQSFNTSSSYINSSVPTKSYNYYLCSSNSTGSENCTSQKTITQTIPNKILTTNFTNSIGDVRSDFYGANVHDSWLKTGRLIDSDEDGSADDQSNTTWHRETFINGGYTYAREDMNLGNYYEGVINKGFESWLNNSIVNISSNKSYELANGWRTRSYTDASGFAYQTTDSHSGTYALSYNCTTAGGSGSVCVFELGRKDLTLSVGKTYNFSLWVKGQGSDALSLQYGGITQNSSNFVLSSSYQQVSVIITPSSTQNLDDWAFKIDLDAPKNITIDDFQITEDGIIVDWWEIGNLTNKTNEYQWASQNNVKILNIISYTPSFLANRSTNCVDDITTDLDDSDCAPFDFDIMGKIVTDYVNRSTNDGQYLNVVDYEDWNEPDISFWLDNLNHGNQQKADLYIIMHNATKTNLKNAYPNICIGGSSSAWFEYTNVSFGYLSNFSDDCFFSQHIYISSGANSFSRTNDIYSTMNNLLLNTTSNCSLYIANCSRIIISEYNLDHQASDDLIKNISSNSNQYSQSIALFLASSLNLYPSNVSMISYQWADQYKYNQTTKYPEYPRQWYSVQEPAMGLEYKPPYNVTKNFANLCPAGSTVYTSSSDDSTIKTVTCKKENSYNVIAINTDTNSKNVSLNISNMPTNLRDYTSMSTYTASQNTNLGIKDSYIITYLGNGVYGNYNNIFWNKETQDITETNANQSTFLANTYSSALRTELYNLTNNLAFYGNNSICGSSSINSNDNNINCSISSNSNLTALNNFNLTEGISRDKSPLWFAQTSLNEIHIASNISAINVTTKINNPGWGENCRFVTELSYTPNGSSTQLWQDDIQAQSICSQLTTTGYVLQVNPSTDSNIIRITYSEQSSGGGGTGGSGGDPLGNTDVILCNLTYNYIKNYSQIDYSFIDSVRGNYSWTEYRRYLDNWQPYCSDAIKRTLKEDFVCDKLFYMIVSKPDYSLIEVNNLRNQIVNDIQISNSLLLNYADNYETMCKYNKKLPFKREKVGNLTIVKNLTDCNLNTSLSLLGLDYDQISIPLGKIYINEKSCKEINNYKWFVKFERDSEGLFINGIKLGWLISIFTFIAIFLIIKTQFKTKAIEKGLFKK